MYCHVHDERQELVENPGETDGVLRLGPYRLPIGEFPQTAKPHPILASYDGATELECGLGILLCWTDHHPAPQAT
jgi:hypothetical protein